MARTPRPARLRSPTPPAGSTSTGNAAITTAITPAGVANPTPIPLPKCAYLGAKQRSTTLPTGVIEMGARVYDPHVGRFLQVDPVYEWVRERL